MTLSPPPWRRRSSPDPVGAAFEAERRQLVLRRIRTVGLVALGPLVVAGGVNVYAFWDHDLFRHLATLGLQTICVLAAVAFTLVRGAEALARPLAIGLSLAIATIEFWAIAISGTDADLMLSAVLAVMLVPSLTFPWGVGPQALLSLHVAIGYLAIVPWSHLDEARIGNILIGTLIGVAVSTGGALVLDRQRRATFVERHQVAALAQQREVLLDVGRRLNSTMDVEALVPLIARLGQQLVDCDFVTMTLFDTEGQRFRTVALARGRDEVVRYEFPGAWRLPALAELLDQRGIVEIPGDAELEAVQSVGRRHGVARMLLVGVQRDGARLGLLSCNQRRGDTPFTDQQRQLAEGIGHQAAIALANARLVEDLQRASRVKSEFLSTMSHELRTPLNVILGFAEMGRDPEIGAAAYPAYFERIEAAGRDLLDLIESTLAIGKLEANREEAEATAVFLPSFWSAVREVCDRFPRSAGVTLDWVCDVPAIEFRTDPRKLEVILRNLVGNALKFTSAGAVRVTAVVGADTLTITVADTGIGIRADDQHTIFEMFRQADSSDSRRFGGTGLGLYIVRQYARLLGGTVGLESAPGEGSRFTVTLPILSGSAAHAA